MSKENSKKLYDHYVAIGRTEAAADMLSKYPDFKAQAKPKEVKKDAK